MSLFALDGVAPHLADANECWVAPGAVVIGNVHLGHDTSIWFNAVIRGDNERIDIGARVNVQELSMLHTDPGFPMSIGADCTIGHKAMLHGCTIGAGSLIGMGATVLNGARIGAGCLVGAGALITEGKEFPDGTLIVGAPARVVRELDDAARERLRRTAAHYVRNWRRFAATLKAAD